MPVLTLKEAANYFGANGELAKQLRAAAHKGLISAAERAKQQIITKEIPERVPPPIDRGIYRAGWQTERLPKGAALYNATPYAAAIEDGVPAGNPVLSTKFQIALLEWLRRKGITPRRTPKLQAGAPGGGQQPPVNRTGVAQDPAAARLQASFPEEWALAGALMRALRNKGIFNRGRGLKILATFAEKRLPAIIREEVDRELRKVIR